MPKAMRWCGHVGRRARRRLAAGARWLGLAFFAWATSGCVAVKSWERGRHAKPCMQLEPEPESSLLEQHVYQYREGSAGGYGGLGGGCGCN